MAGRWVAALMMLWIWVGVAAADGPPTTLSGRVTDLLGRPVAGARLYVLAKSGRRAETRTNKDGRYSVGLATQGVHGVVIAIDQAHTYRKVLVEPGRTTKLDIEAELDVEGGEVIKIVDRTPPLPAVKPKPLTDPRKAMPYSDEAVERDAWARAWLLLDVDATGVVTRLKLLKPPGFDLDKIAIEQGFKLRFEPARDAEGRPMRTYVVWSMEWPSWGWLVTGNGTAVRQPNDSDQLHTWSQNRGVTRLPEAEVPVGPGVGANIGRADWARPGAVAFPQALARVPCAGSGPLNLDLRNRAYRDCSGYSLESADALPWITRETAAMAVAELADKRALPGPPRPPRSRVPDIISTAVTGGLLVVLVGSYVRFEHHAERAQDFKWQLTIDPDEYEKIVGTRDRWAKLSLASSAAFVLSGALTLFLWNRDAPPSSFSVQPTGDGGATAALRATF